MCYLVLHIFDLKVDEASFSDALGREVEPHAIDIFGVVRSDPNGVLSG